MSLQQESPLETQGEYKLNETDNLPVKNRRRTDVFCTILNTTFVVLLFLIFLFTFNADNLRKITYPNDAEGTLCGFDAPKYPYLYYASLTDPSKRLCVAKCPTANDQSLICKPTASLSCRKNADPKYEVDIYDTYLEENRIGLFCLPKDEAMKEQVLRNSNVQEKFNFLGFYDTMWRSIWISAIFGVVSFLIIHFLPYKAVPWTILIGGISSVLFGLLILILADGYFLVKLLLFIFFVGLGIFSGITLFNSNRRESVFICSRLIHAATITHENKTYTELAPFSLDGFIKLWKPVAVVAIFMILFGGFLVLIGFEVLSAWSCGKLVFRSDYPFYEVVGFGSNLLQILIFLELVWGMSFLKESFNFIVSGHAARWYYSNSEGSEEDSNKSENISYIDILQLLFWYHWGSVAGGSIMLAFFYFIDLVADFIWPEDIEKSFANKTPIDFDREFESEDTKGAKSFFNLIRSESFAYTVLTNQAYCISARTCEFLSGSSAFYNFSQTTNRIFRINQHMIPIFFTLFIALFTMKSAGSASPYGILFVCVISFFTVTYFLAYHGDKAEGILIAAYLDESINDELTKAPQVVRIAYENDKSNKYKGISLWNRLFDTDLNPQ